MVLTEQAGGRAGCAFSGDPGGRSPPGKRQCDHDLQRGLTRRDLGGAAVRPGEAVRQTVANCCKVLQALAARVA
eukprot:8605538-Alexandrium_andersonii.AAC.1